MKKYLIISGLRTGEVVFGTFRGKGTRYEGFVEGDDLRLYGSRTVLSSGSSFQWKGDKWEVVYLDFDAIGIKREGEAASFGLISEFVKDIINHETFVNL